MLQGTVETYATVGGALPRSPPPRAARMPGNPSLISVNNNHNLSRHDADRRALPAQRPRTSRCRTASSAGSIVSEPALSASGWAPADATTITLSGTVVIESDSTLAGCSIIAPDATVSGDGTEAVQITGSVSCAARSP